MIDYEFDYELDSKGPKGISINSWLAKDKIALVLIDFQNYWLDEKYGSASEIVWKESTTQNYVLKRYKEVVLPNVLKLIKRFRELNQKIIYLRNASLNKRLSDIKGVLKKVYAYELKDRNNIPYHMYSEEHASQIVEDLKPLAEDIVITKSSMGAFSSSGIDGILQKNGISCLVFSGGYTDACVDSTVRSAIDRGYLCTIAEDACISNIEEDHTAALRILDKYFAWVTSTTNIISNL